EPVAAARGTPGGGAALTPFGMRLIEQYRAVEAEAHSATAARLRELEAACEGVREAARAVRFRSALRPPHDCSLTSRKNTAQPPGKKFGGKQRQHRNRDRYEGQSEGARAATWGLGQGVDQ